MRSRHPHVTALVSAVLAAAAAGSLLAIGSASATPSATATIVLMRNGDLNEIGWYGDFPAFSSVPAFSDAGARWTSDHRAFGGGKSSVFAGLIKTTEYSDQGHGSFQTDFQLLDAKGTFSGNCQVTGKTGDYARLHGTGSWTYFEEGGIRHYKCTARVHWD